MVEKCNIHYDFPVVCENNIYIHTKMQTYIYIIHTFQRSVSLKKKWPLVWSKCRKNTDIVKYY